MFLPVTMREMEDPHPTTSAANPGKGGSGGAIYSSNRVTVNNSTFDGNYAGNGGEGTNFNNGADGGSGGAIYNTGIIHHHQF